MESGPPSSGSTLASEYALRVALQTMKERCVVLQRRLTVLEEDNQDLRERIEHGRTTIPAISSQNNNNNTDGSCNGGDELLQLRVNVAELNRQKQQLSEHINMVSNENRKLWSRLSQIAKDKSGAQRSNVTTTGQDTIVAGIDGEDPEELQITARNGSAASQNLVRSKTFTQHSPNPNLRHRLIPNSSELSMEEIILDNYEEKDALVASAAPDDDLGFAYLNVDDDGVGEAIIENEADFDAVAKRCMEGLHEMRREAIKQQQELNTALTVLESKIALQPCRDCATKSQKPEMADKSLETDESLSEMPFAILSNKARKAGSNYGGESEETMDDDNALPAENGFYNNIQKLVNAESTERLCPMCGKKFENTMPWEPFQQHVEAHFIEVGVDF